MVSSREQSGRVDGENELGKKNSSNLHKSFSCSILVHKGRIHLLLPFAWWVCNRQPLEWKAPAAPNGVLLQGSPPWHVDTDRSSLMHLSIAWYQLCYNQTLQMHFISDGHATRAPMSDFGHVSFCSNTERMAVYGCIERRFDECHIISSLR